jgi:uncharacterized Fe-S cluster-containing radical SAM superfamily protein
VTDCKHELVISKWYGTNTTLTATEFICTKCYNFFSRESLDKFRKVALDEAVASDDVKDPWFIF